VNATVIKAAALKTAGFNVAGTGVLTGPSLQLPWSSTGDDDARFQRILRGMLAGFVVLAVAVPFIPVPELKREELETLPPQLARVSLEKKEIPKPQVKKPPKPKVEKQVVKKKPKPKPPKVAEKKPPPVEKPVANLETARQKAATSGLLQFQDDLMEMRASMDVAKVSGASITRGEARAKKLDRSVISSQAKTASGGINTAALSRDTGGVALSGRETTKVKSDLAKAKGLGQHAAQPRSERSARSDEAIRKVMDRNKGAIFAIYNRALRRNPALQGKVTVSMVIEPSGKISDIQLVSSELNDLSLEKKLLARIRMILFGAEDVIRTTLNYSFDFLPY